MKRILPILFFLFVFLFPKSVYATISLEISNVEKGESSYSLDAKLSGISASSNCYVQMAITAPDDPHYFGQTWSPKGEWFKYISSPTKEYIKEYFIKLENDQTTKILFNTDPEDSDYKGPGEYLVKLKRYTGESSSSAGESNALTFTIADPTPSPTSTPTGTPTSTPTSTPTQTSTPTPTKTPTPTPTKTPTQINTPTKVSTTAPTLAPRSPALPAGGLDEAGSTISAVLGESTDSASINANTATNLKAPPSPEKKINKPTNYKIPFFIGIFLAVSSGSLLYFRHRKD